MSGLYFIIQKLNIPNIIQYLKNVTNNPVYNSLKYHPKNINIKLINIKGQKEVNTLANKERASKSPNAKNRPVINSNNNNNNHERIIKVSSISNLDTGKAGQQLNKNTHLQSTLPANVEKGFLNDGMKNNFSDKKKPQVRNKSERIDKNQNEAGQSPTIPNRVMLFNQRNQDYEQQLQQQNIENSKTSSQQKIALPKNFTQIKDQQQKLESIIQNQRNIFFSPITNNGINNQGSIKKSQKQDFNPFAQNSSIKKINVKENYISDLITPLQQNYENNNVMSINDYADQAFLSNQKKSVVFTDQVIQGLKQQQGNNSGSSNQSPPQVGRKYFTPKLSTVRKDSTEYGNEKNNSPIPNIFTKQQQNIALHQIQMHKSNSTKNTTQSTSSPTTQKGARQAINQQNTQKPLQSPNKDQMKQMNLMNQFNTLGNYLDSSNNLQETLRENESQTQFNNNQNYATKLPEIGSSSALSTRPKGNGQNVMDIFQQKNKINNQQINQDQQKQSQPNQFQLQQQYSSRKNSNKGIQQQSMNASIFTNSSCIQLTNSSQINSSQNKNSQQIEESKKSQSLARGDQRYQLPKNFSSKQNDNRETEEVSISSISPKHSIRKSLVQYEQISSSRKQIEENHNLRKNQRNNSNIESVKKQNNKSFQFEEYKQSGKSQKNIEDNDQIRQKPQQQHFQSNPTYNSKQSINEFTESQQSIRDNIDNTNENYDQQEYLNYKNGSLNSSKKKRKNQISNTAIRNSQNNSQIEGLGVNSYNVSGINNNGFKEEDENIFENNSLFSDKKNQNGFQQILSLNASKKQQQSVVLPKIKQQIPLSRNFYQGSQGNLAANINQKNEYNSLHGSQRSMSNGNQNYYSQQVNQNNQKNIFNSKDIEELNHLFQVESNKSGGTGLMYQGYRQNQNEEIMMSGNNSNNSLNYGNDVHEKIGQNNYQQENNQNMKQNKQLSYNKKVESLENEIYELQTHINSRQKNLNQQLGISQFSELYSTLRQKIKNIQDLEQCNMKEIDSIINNCIKNCNSKTMSNIYSLLRSQIKLDRALQELDSLKNGHNN